MTLLSHGITMSNEIIEIKKHLKNRLIEIAGQNIFGIRDSRLEGTCLGIDYLLTQYTMAAKNAGYGEKEIQSVLENVKNYLEWKKE